jgi:hypothetical protein
MVLLLTLLLTVVMTSMSLIGQREDAERAS